MKNKYLEEKMVDLINGKLSGEEKEELFSELENSGFSLDELEELKRIYNSLDEIEIPEPPISMDEKFYNHLYSNKGKSNYNFRSIIELVMQNKTAWRVAAGIALFIFGWIGGIKFTHSIHRDDYVVSLQNEIVDMKKIVMLNMMEQQSPTDRIKAVHMAEELPEIDNKIILALLRTLNEDSNDNVRLVALETLKEYAYYPQVREGLILSISKQTSPLLQLALAETMVELQEKRAVPHLEEILMDKSLNYTVRNKIDESLKTLI